jgi:hypothetical protein
MSKRALIFASVVGVIIFASMSVSGRDRPAAAELNTSNRLVRGDFNNDGIVLFPTDVIPAARVAFGIDPPPQPLVIPLDQDGYLAVHEQGVVDVNVLNSSQLTAVASGVEVQPNSRVSVGAFVNLEACDEVSLYLRIVSQSDHGTFGNDWGYAFVDYSLDGVTTFGSANYALASVAISLPQNSPAGTVKEIAGTQGSGLSPWGRVSVYFAGGYPAGLVDAWIYCKA